MKAKELLDALADSDPESEVMFSVFETETGRMYSNLVPISEVDVIFPNDVEVTNLIYVNDSKKNMVAGWENMTDEEKNNYLDERHTWDLYS